MKTTLNISDVTMRALKREGARRGQTMLALVETALRGIVSTQPPATSLPKLPAFHCGGARVNVADRRALHDAMER